jgi:hypothetical protein
MAKKRRSRRSSSGIPLPWEQRAAALRGVLGGSRFRVALMVITLGLTAWLVFRAADHEMRTRRTRAAIDEVHRAIDAFRAEVGRCPDGTDELTNPPREGNRYLREIPNDGWGKPLYVACPAYDDPDGAEVVSAGPSGDFFVDDNVR